MRGTDNSSWRRARGWYGVGLAFSLLLPGAAVGGWIAASRTTSTMGWDQLANFLGGAVLGAGGGVVIAAVLAIRLSIPALRVVLLVTALLSGTGIAFLTWRAHVAISQAKADTVSPRTVTKPSTPPTD